MINIIHRYLPSTCYKKSRSGIVDTLVIHYISAMNIDRDDPFNVDRIIKIFRDYKVSAHYLIDRDGIVYRLVDECDTAYHAGVSVLRGRKYCNRFSIGVELIGTNDVEFTDEQYKSLILLSIYIRSKHDIPLENIVGHNDIAPGRKIDPGKMFDWNRYKEGLKIKYTYIDHNDKGDDNEHKDKGKSVEYKEDDKSIEKNNEDKKTDSWVDRIFNILYTIIRGH